MIGIRDELLFGDQWPTVWSPDEYYAFRAWLRQNVDTAIAVDATATAEGVVDGIFKVKWGPTSGPNRGQREIYFYRHENGDIDLLYWK
jgi:hypothetical protein